eukprot:10566809-Lingulodinium_polyedra.AAC.1
MARWRGPGQPGAKPGHGPDWGAWYLGVLGYDTAGAKSARGRTADGQGGPAQGQDAAPRRAARRAR